MLGRYFNIQSGNNSAIAVGPSGGNRTFRPRYSRDSAGQFVQLARDQTGAEDDAKPLGVDRPLAQAPFDARQIGGRKGQLNVAAHHLQAFPRPDVLFRVKVGHHAADRRRQRRVAGQIEPPNAAPALAQRGPKRILPDPNRADYPHTGDNNVRLGRHAGKNLRDVRFQPLIVASPNLADKMLPMWGYAAAPAAAGRLS